jgi:hypothetical protein
VIRAELNSHYPSRGGLISWKSDEMIRSFLSALAGWVASIFALPVAGYLNERTITHLSWGFIREDACLGAIFIFPVWLCILWPLYVLIPFPSLLWSPYICIPCGAVAGGLILCAVIPVFFELPLNPYVYVASFVGAVTCAIGRALRCSEQRSRPRQPATGAGGNQT